MEFGYGTEKASYLSPWDLCGGALSVSSLRDQDFMKTVLGLLSAIHQLHHGVETLPACYDNRHLPLRCRLPGFRPNDARLRHSW